MSLSSMNREKKAKSAYMSLVVVGMKNQVDNEGKVFKDLDFSSIKDEDVKKEAISYMKKYIDIKVVRGFEI